MFDYVGRDSLKPRAQTRRKGSTPLIEKVKFVCIAFPTVFTVLFILNQIMEHAHHHG